MTRHALCGAGPATLTAVAALAFATPIASQERPLLRASDYGRWEQPGALRTSPDGAWVAYEVTRNDEKSELRIRRLTEDSTRAVPWGEDAAFAASGDWLAYAIGLPEDERERLEEEDEPVRLDAGVLDLRSGTTRTFEAVRAFSFDAEGRYLALHGYAPEEPEGKGADLRVIDLASGSSTTLGNVDALAWSAAGSWLALAIATGMDDGNGVQVYEAGSGRIRSLDTSGSAYAGLAWREDALDLAVLRSLDVASEEGTAHELLAWRGLDAAASAALVLREGTSGLADSLEIVATRTPTWSEDGTKISLGLRPAETEDEADSDESDASEEDDASEGPEDESAEDEGEEEPELPDLQIWHSSDVRIFPQQRAAESADERRSLLAVWLLDDERVVQIGSHLLGTARLLEGWRRATEHVDEPYPWGAMFGRRYHDVWVIDVQSGTREKVWEEVRFDWPSTGGRYLLSFDGQDYTSHDLETGRRTNLTAGLTATFADTTFDTPTDVLPPWGFGPGGWLEDDAAVLLQDRYDVWSIAPDGSGATRLTDGSAERLIHRVASLPDDDVPGLEADEPVYLSLRGEWSEQRGYARALPGGGTERLILRDAYVSGLAKADSSATYFYREMAFDDPPDYFVAGPELAGARQITDINPFIDDYAWGRVELVDFTSEAGVPLQAVLHHPAGYAAGTRVPMIVYTYEELSSQAHVFHTPSERDYYDVTTWTQNGYAVLQPDIVYRPREPGISALESVRAAVARVVEMGVADPDAVGLIGHSWGGYQATFLPTRTDIFAASVAGAPLTDFVSMMGAIHWSPGIPEVDHWETGQARMEVPFWEDPEAHRRNSPVHGVQDLETPLLMAFGDDDGTVDWDQGTQFYNFARRAGKQMVLLVYEGEDHGFREKANQIDYHRRILEWFGHYLKGEPAPAWITEGVGVEELEEEKERVARKGSAGR